MVTVWRISAGTLRRLLALFGLAALLTAAPAVSTAQPLAISDFSRDRVLFDSGAAFGRNLAGIPISGRAPPGAVVEARAVSETGAEIVPWKEMPPASAAGQWSGRLNVPRDRDWLFAEARLRSDPESTARTANRFGVGHVVAIWGQSSLARQWMPFFSKTPPPPIPRDDAVQVMWLDDGVRLKHLTNADPQTAAFAAMAATLLAARPDDKFAIIHHTQSGTDPRELVDDGNRKRMWRDDAALHAFATADGQQVGLASLMWYAAPGSMGNAFGDVMTQILFGKTPAGAPVGAGSRIRISKNRALQLDHTFTELYDPAQTKWVFFGLNRFGIKRSMSNADTGRNGKVDWSLRNKERLRQSMIGMMRSPVVTQSALPMTVDPIAYQLGVSDGNGGWKDLTHPAADTPDGLERLARYVAIGFLDALGLADWPMPEFDQIAWDPSGRFVEFGSSAGPVTTTRIARGLGPLPARYPHWTGVVGWEVNGAPVTRAEIVDGRVRVYAQGPRLLRKGDRITFGAGGATGMLQFPDDYQAGLWMDLPIVDVGAPGVEGLPVRPFLGGRR